MFDFSKIVFTDSETKAITEHQAIAPDYSYFIKIGLALKKMGFITDEIIDNSFITGSIYNAKGERLLNFIHDWTSNEYYGPKNDDGFSGIALFCIERQSSEHPNIKIDYEKQDENNKIEANKNSFSLTITPATIKTFAYLGTMFDKPFVNILTLKENRVRGIKGYRLSTFDNRFSRIAEDDHKKVEEKATELGFVEIPSDVADQLLKEDYSKAHLYCTDKKFLRAIKEFINEK
jgi:hypothetical protein